MDEEGEPTWMYRRRGGEVESRIFDSLNIPEGWVDSPAKCPKEPVGVVAETDGRKIKPRRQKVRDGDSA